MNIVILSVVHLSKLGCFVFFDCCCNGRDRCTSRRSEATARRSEGWAGGDVPKASEERPKGELTLSSRRPMRSSTVLMRMWRISCMRHEAAVAKAEPTAEGRTKEALEKIKEALTEDVW